MQRMPSGEQWTIRRGDVAATVVEVGGGLRELTVGDLELTAGYAVDEMSTSCRGQVLAPWPNRIRDGRYTFDGVQQQLPLTEPELHNASHGLARWTLWELLERAEDSVTVGYRLYPVPGWPGHLDLRLVYRLVEAGIEVEVSAENTGAVRVPFGFGAHPYVGIGDIDAGKVVLTIPADQAVEVDERLLPTAVVPVAGELDFRGGRALGGTELDTAYTGLARAAGRWEALVDAPGRPGIVVWGDEALGWIQVFTRKARAGQPGRHGIAIEPMSCPPDAFNSGDSLVVLEPGQRWSATWGLRLA
ncbi:MAG: aldose 1-epimerase family protein [Micrococcales bacterium]|nr:aldose 1-epimerase family protein [Micrococcales bacterium]